MKQSSRSKQGGYRSGYPRALVGSSGADSRLHVTAPAVSGDRRGGQAVESELPRLGGEGHEGCLSVSVRTVLLVSRCLFHTWR